MYSERLVHIRKQEKAKASKKGLAQGAVAYASSGRSYTSAIATTVANSS